eukprot:755673-Hanusia_phi.AAC.1
MWASLGLSSSSNSQAKQGKPGEGLEDAAVLVAKEASSINSVVSRRTVGGEGGRGVEEEKLIVCDPAEPLREDATERMRRIERRAAAAQQRSLDKKIAALTGDIFLMKEGAMGCGEGHGKVGGGRREERHGKECSNDFLGSEEMAEVEALLNRSLTKRTVRGT